MTPVLFLAMLMMDLTPLPQDSTRDQAEKVYFAGCAKRNKGDIDGAIKDFGEALKLLANRAGLIDSDFAILVSIVSDEQNRTGVDVFIDPWAILRRSLGGRLGPSGDYDSLLLFGPCATMSRGSLPASRNAVRFIGAANSFRRTRKARCYRNLGG